MRSKPYVRFDEIENVLTSLDLLALVAKQLRTHPSYWKWAILASHDSLQGAMVCVLSGTAGIGALNKASAKAMSEWHEARQGSYPEEWLADFPTLLKRSQKSALTTSQPLVLDSQQRKDLKKLHDEFRNNFVHFNPKSWLIETAGLPRILLTGLDCVDHLMENPQVTYKLSGNRKRRLKRNLNTIRKVLCE